MESASKKPTKGWLTKFLERLADANQKEFRGLPLKCKGNCLECGLSKFHGSSRTTLS